MEVVRMSLELDARIDAVKDCLSRCSRLFEMCISVADRNRAFEELTCMLGEGYRPLPGLEAGSEQWRKQGTRFSECCNLVEY
jgi:hypothetical protein